MGKNSDKFVLGAIVAGIIGYIAGVLTAPKSGKETREDIKVAASKGIAEAEKQLKKVHTELSAVLADATAKADQLSGKAKEELERLAQKAAKAKEKVRVALSAIHDGKADDEDLDKALKEAKDSLSALKTYLKK